eukprot:1159883-Pelagomonas_calceolata.AAC.1
MLVADWLILTLLVTDCTLAKWDGRQQHLWKSLLLICSADAGHRILHLQWPFSKAICTFPVSKRALS